ncbi:MAG: SET domain-containing protein [Pirellulaceae bacterium]
MLLVETKLGPSRIHGLGIFAVAPIASGTPIWHFTVGFDLDLDPAILERQPEHFRRMMMHYGYIDARLYRFILCCDDYRFINHSANPNVIGEWTDDKYGIDRARRDICAGEELTIDYNVVEGDCPDH